MSSKSLKWGSRTVNKENLTSLSVADMDFAIEEHLLEEMRKRMEHPMFGYEFTPDTLDDAFADWAFYPCVYQYNITGIITV